MECLNFFRNVLQFFIEKLEDLDNQKKRFRTMILKKIKILDERINSIEKNFLTLVVK